MVGVMAGLPLDVEASCAICGAPPFPECPHEGERLELALNQAMDRWTARQTLRDWVLDHARNQIITTFQHLKALRYERHIAHLQSIPCYALYQRYNGNPPIAPQQMQQLYAQIQHANGLYKQGIDEDWRRSCLRYPEVLDYYFSLVKVQYPSEQDAAVMDPRFGGPPRETKRVKASGEKESKESRKKDKDRDRDREKRYSRGRTPPAAPMPGSWTR